jgi:hypothetical protein
MPRSTPKISYSLKDRGRKHTGQPRNYNIKMIFDYINSPECQETVESRGMTGYYGHWPRIRFGMHPSEGGLDSGKPVPVEPAFVTTHLSMTMDGVIEHVAEFLDTASGKLAEKLFFDNQVGGFSSAIDDREKKFFGFDYVIQPNYLGNSFRGVTLDDAMGGNIGELTYDDVYAAEQEEHLQAISALLDSAASERAASNEVIERLREENDQLLGFLARHNVDPSVVLDSSDQDNGKPLLVSLDSARMIEKDISDFRKSKNLPRLDDASSGKGKDPIYDNITRLIRR